MKRAIWFCLLFPVLGSLVSSTALALDFGAGVSIGAVYVGTRAVPAITPHVGMSVQAESGLLFALQDRPSILPATNRDGVGLYNHLVAALGYTWGNGDVRGGPSFVAYFMPACRDKLCGVVAGIGVGADLQANGSLLSRPDEEIGTRGGAARAHPGSRGPGVKGGVGQNRGQRAEAWQAAC